MAVPPRPAMDVGVQKIVLKSKKVSEGFGPRRLRRQQHFIVSCGYF
jgi:hypothetical protein